LNHSGPGSRSSLANRIERVEDAPGEVFLLPASVSSVTSFFASYTSVPDFEAGEEVIRDVTVAMLDKGTHTRDKLEIASLIENTGARLSFSNNGIRGTVSGKVLTPDLKLILSLMREQMQEPSFPEVELDRIKERFKAGIQQSMLNTGARASAALYSSMFKLPHPNYSIDPEKELSLLESISIEQVRKYHANKMNLRNWRMAFVGDLTRKDLADAGLDELQIVESSDIPKWDLVYPEKVSSGRLEFPLPDRDNLDVHMGHPVALYRTDPDYLSLSLGIFILGGNFSARLMQTVRDEMGLTYGVGSAMTGMGRHYNGLWRTNIALSSEKLEEGIEATIAELHRFIMDGVTEDEVSEKSETIAGSFKVGLSTTSSLAKSIVAIRQRGEELDYLDSFPDTIRSLSAGDVNRVIQKYLREDALTVSVAGTFPARSDSSE